MEIVSQLTINSLIVGSITALTAVGFSLIYSVTKFFNMAHGTTLVVGAYTAFWLSKTLGLHISFGIIGGVIAAGILGYIFDKVIYKTLRTKKSSNMTLLIASLGLFTAGQALIAILFTNQFHTITKTATRKVFEIFGGAITDLQIITIAVSIALSLGVVLLVQKTKFGKAIQAISDDEEVAKVVGINTDKLIGYTFIIGSMIAGLSGILWGLDTGITPQMGLFLLLGGITGAIIGGMGNVYGALLGGYFIGFSESMAVWFTSGEWRFTISFTILIIFLLVRPKGIINN